MRHLISLLLAALLAGHAFADDDIAGDFDYYVMALSWSPNWCAIEGDAKRSPQCDTGEDHGWVLHGLWPQYHQGWPDYCRTTHRNPPRSLTNDMADIMGTSGLAWHQWKKHGTCSGLSAEDYFALSRQAYDSVTRPTVFRELDQTVRLPASVVEQAFLKANPRLAPDTLTITCRDGFIQEARVCLSRDLNPVPCGRDVSRDCKLDSARFDPLR
ncbi:ribonuclease I [Shimia sp. SK013]|uniref:ribonuclease T2 family protein n=1 Tax=Shimia sp. SK013 TaxID=1389006 RepID=UPI0006B55FE2|nr:ribonuclease T2 [Shimia sp. SK013]KPA23254.1 ribonuclease I [Shimia sp. SK013]